MECMSDTSGTEASGQDHRGLEHLLYPWHDLIRVDGEGASGDDGGFRIDEVGTSEEHSRQR
jgi:hypothetical protein